MARLDALKCDFQPEDPAGCAALLTDKSTLAWKVSTALENRDADGVYRPAGEEVQQINAAIHDVTSTDFADERCYVPTANATKASTCGMIALSKDMAFTTLTLRLRTLAGLA
ncbi:hypothetical protein H849_24489 [Prescottella equi NBRC 101255 = C 7]|nr:hypothetical protein H849_24489 [Prescottella equi NBRC 101255 = C 7]